MLTPILTIIITIKQKLIKENRSAILSQALKCKEMKERLVLVTKIKSKAETVVLGYKE